jgi:hypothetical protein
VISSDVTTTIIAASSVGATWLVAILTRKGAKEDKRVREEDQAFAQMKTLAETRLAEITRLQARVDSLEDDRQTDRDRDLTRFDAQGVRCRAASSALVESIERLRAEGCTPAASRQADDALHALDEHRERDHEDRLS